MSKCFDMSVFSHHCHCKTIEECCNRQFQPTAKKQRAQSKCCRLPLTVHHFIRRHLFSVSLTLFIFHHRWLLLTVCTVQSEINPNPTFVRRRLNTQKADNYAMHHELVDANKFICSWKELWRIWTHRYYHVTHIAMWWWCETKTKQKMKYRECERVICSAFFAKCNFCCKNFSNPIINIIFIDHFWNWSR